MKTLPNEFVTVHMRGLKPALIARAEAQGISVSQLLRRAVERELGVAVASTSHDLIGKFSVAAAPAIKMSIRFTRADAELLKASAREAGLSHGAFVMWLLVQLRLAGANTSSHRDCVAALTLSCAELATLGRNVGRLSALLRHGKVEAAKEYRRILDTLANDVRAHLRLASGVLGALKPVRRVREPGSRGTGEQGKIDGVLTSVAAPRT